MQGRCLPGLFQDEADALGCELWLQRPEIRGVELVKTRKNFRLSAEALSHLERLSGLWGCDYTSAVERALAEADPSHMDVQERADTQAALEEPTTAVAEIIGPLSPEMDTETVVPPPVRQTSPTKFRQEIKKPEWKK